LAKKSVETQVLEQPKESKFNILKIILVLTLILIITGGMYLSEITFSTPDSSANPLNKFNPFRHLANLISSADKKLSGEGSDRINFLLMGVGGVGHEGPFLTDTIILGSIKPSTSEIALISLPRDLIIKLQDNSYQKINSIYAYEYAENYKTAGVDATAIIEENLGIKIHYHSIIDFTGFETFIDDLGGINIDVVRSFVDESFPTDDFLTQTVSFEQGMQLMDGNTALMFVRSRHGTNGESGDFARSRRQQLLIQAVKDKVLSFSTLTSPKKISSIFELLDDHVDTNISVWQALKLAEIAKSIDNENISRFVLDDSPGSLLEPMITEEGAYVLQPRNGDYNKLSSLIKNIFELNKIKDENAKIAIQNGTEITGLALYTYLYLEKINYNVISYDNAPSDDYQKTIIYDLTDGEKELTLEKLENDLDAYIAKDVPEYILQEYNLNATTTPSSLNNQPDIIIILGQDHANEFKIPEPKIETSTSTDEVIEEILED
ncbi:LCP family protein, partial [bacterium]|nr:LCP family protein [bacterium]